MSIIIGDSAALVYGIDAAKSSGAGNIWVMGLLTVDSSGLSAVYRH